MSHRKVEHSDSVQTCRNFLKGICEYISCWFKHTETENLNQNEVLKDPKTIEKLFEMMEKLTHRLIQIENQITIT